MAALISALIQLIHLDALTPLGMSGFGKTHYYENLELYSRDA